MLARCVIGSGSIGHFFRAHSLQLRPSPVWRHRPLHLNPLKERVLWDFVASAELNLQQPVANRGRLKASGYVCNKRNVFRYANLLIAGLKGEPAYSRIRRHQGQAFGVYPVEDHLEVIAHRCWKLLCLPASGADPCIALGQIHHDRAVVCGEPEDTCRDLEVRHRRSPHQSLGFGKTTQNNQGIWPEAKLL